MQRMEPFSVPNRRLFVSLAAWSVVALAAAGSALRYSLQGEVVGSEQVYAALSAYVMAGLYLGVAYWAIAVLAPGSLTVPAHDAGAIPHLDTMIYFSFVTLASLGYGDVLPVHPAVRGLAVIEVICGQLYLAVLVARNNLQAAESNYRLSVDKLAPAESYYHLVSRGFGEGTHSFLELMDAQVKLTDARLQINLTRYKFLSAQAEYERQSASYPLN